MKDDRVYIEHIQASINKIELYILGMDRIAFSKDTLVQDAVIRKLEIIGEATKRISKKFKEENPQVPWSDMAGMRDVLIHDYIDVDHDIVWRTASVRIGELKEQINKVKYPNR